MNDTCVPHGSEGVCLLIILAKELLNRGKKKKRKKMKTKGEEGVLKEIFQNQDQNNLLQTTTLNI